MPLVHTCVDSLRIHTCANGATLQHGHGHKRPNGHDAEISHRPDHHPWGGAVCLARSTSSIARRHDCRDHWNIDHAVDTVSASLLGGSSQISEAVRRRRVEASPSDTFVEQLLGLRLTRQQVERGHAFAAGVVERAGQDGLAALFAAAGNLPTPNELDAPGLWLARLNIEQRDINE